jgi:hypothetical protein
MSNRLVVNSPQALKRICEQTLPELFARGKYVVITWEFGAPATRGQKALFKIWVRRIAAHFLRKREKDVTKDEMEEFTRRIKLKYYTQTHEPFVIKQEGQPLHPDKKDLEVTSSKDWLQMEMFRVMEFLQTWMADEFGLILESTGEHRDLKHTHNR